MEMTAVGDVWRPSVRLTFDEHGIARPPLSRLLEGTIAIDLAGR
jgi:hypothetical protein